MALRPRTKASSEKLREPWRTHRGKRNNTDLPLAAFMDRPESDGGMIPEVGSGHFTPDHKSRYGTGQTERYQRVPNKFDTACKEVLRVANCHVPPRTQK